MSTIKILVAAVLMMCSAAVAFAADVSDTDKAQIETIIRSQMDAFQRDDDAEAFSYASPGIQRQFGTSSTFMMMVKQGYQPVYRPQSVTFLGVEIKDGAVVQSVAVIGPDGVNYTALYPMERQADGTWRIAGCFLVKEPGEAV